VADIKIGKLEPDKIKPYEPKLEAKEAIEQETTEPGEPSIILKISAVAGAIVLLMIGIWWWVSLQKETKPIAIQKGRIFVAPAPDNATVKVLNIDKPFQQGIELDPGKYHLQVSSEGYEPQERWIELGPGETSRIILTLKKIPSKVGRLFVKTVPKDATVKILNIRPKFSQGMKLEPGYYHVEVSAQGYKTERRYIDLEAGNEEPFRFELEKVFGRLYVDVVPGNAVVKILNNDKVFQQGMELNPGIYHVQVSSQGYKTRKESINIKSGEEKRIKFELVASKTYVNEIGMNFVLIQASSFTMGSQLTAEEVAHRYGGRAEYFRDEHPSHPVKITKPFYLQTTEVSQGQWKKVMGNNASRFEDCGDDCPVERVSWNDAQKFISKLNQMEGTTKYRLPTEAEWEYACRAGTKTPFFTGDCISTDQANYHAEYPTKNCPKGQYREKTVKVASFKPNAWGLYDMHGNVWEWCQDWYGDYPSKLVVDPKGPDKGEKRVIRGGSWKLLYGGVRSATRLGSTPSHYSAAMGFRVARDF
jgi:formylglycine-generating enzyme required for sulfatase activity